MKQIIDLSKPIEWNTPLKQNNYFEYFVKSPDAIIRNGDFFHLLKMLLGEPPIRKYMVNKYYPYHHYNLYKLDYNDKNILKKVNKMKKQINKNEDIIIDIAEQIVWRGGGHWTSIKRDDGMLEYMDPDPFYYSEMAKAIKKHKAYHNMITNINSPINIYGNLKNGEKSIQNINSMDTFCQSWSLFYITLGKNVENIETRIRFKNKNEMGENMDAFLYNIMFLIDFWIELFNNDVTYNNIISNTQWKKWNNVVLVDRLKSIKDYIEKSRQAIIDNIFGEQSELFCIGDQYIKSHIINNYVSR